jgi:hypothetical protein
MMPASRLGSRLLRRPSFVPHPRHYERGGTVTPFIVHNGFVNVHQWTQEMMDQAESIQISGRWSAANTKIERLAQNPVAENEWYGRTLAALLFHVFSEYLSLRLIYQTNQGSDVSCLAWRARNLIELCVWCRYCTKSRENARRFYGDAGRDQISMITAYKKNEATASETELLEALTQAEADLKERASVDGVEVLDQSYLRVQDAAKECGLANHYQLFYKMASKFAHPTAMLILASPDKLTEEIGLRDYLFGEGCMLFVGAFEALESRLHDLEADGG